MCLLTKQVFKVKSKNVILKVIKPWKMSVVEMMLAHCRLAHQNYKISVPETKSSQIKVIFLQTNVIPECGNRITSFSLITTASISCLECVWCISCYILQTPVINHNLPTITIATMYLPQLGIFHNAGIFFVWVMSLLDIFSYCLVIFVNNCNGCQTIEQ